MSDRDVEELRLYRTRVMLAAGCMVLAMLVFLVQFAGIVRAKPPDDKPG